MVWTISRNCCSKMPFDGSAAGWLDYKYIWPIHFLWNISLWIILLCLLNLHSNNSVRNILVLFLWMHLQIINACAILWKLKMYLNAKCVPRFCSGVALVNIFLFANFSQKFISTHCTHNHNSDFCSTGIFCLFSTLYFCETHLQFFHISSHFNP